MEATPETRMAGERKPSPKPPRMVTNWLECVRCHTPTDLPKCPKCGDPVRVRS